MDRKARNAAGAAGAKTLFSPGVSIRSARSSPSAKNISLFQKIKSGVWCAHPAATRGAYRDRHGRSKRDAVDEDCTLAERRNSRTAKSCGPDPPTLGSSFAETFGRATEAIKPGTPTVLRGEREISRKTIAQGRPDCFGGPVVTNACAFYPRTRGYGCAKHPAFPAPSDFSRDTNDASLGHFVPRDSGSLARCPRVGKAKRAHLRLPCS
jgi:hypothetical protein